MRSKFKQVLLLTGVFALPFAVPPFAESALMEYFSVFEPLNNSSVTGSALLILDTVKEFLTVKSMPLD